MSNKHNSGAPHDPCGRSDSKPSRPWNRPGLTDLRYRIGRHGEFFERMLKEFPRQIYTESAGGEKLRLKARTHDDPTVALADAWASTLDVLTFYQERIANEGYLRTAKERMSVLELARTIGYELDPGVAASTYLSFIVEDADDPFRKVEVPTGTQVMSVPQKKGELPQIFETVETIKTRAEWNAIPARTERPQNLVLYYNAGDSSDSNNDKLFLIDTDGSFNLDDFPEEEKLTIKSDNVNNIFPVTPGLNVQAALDDLIEDAKVNPEIDPFIHAVEVNQIQIRGTGLGLSEGDRLIAVGVRQREAGNPDIRVVPYRIAGLEPDDNFNLTRIDLVEIKPDVKFRPLRALLFRMPKLRLGMVKIKQVPFKGRDVRKEVLRTSWTGPRLKAFVKTQRWPRVKLMRLVRRLRAPQVSPPPIGQAAPGLHVLRQHAGFFGHAAPLWESLAKDGESRGTDPYRNKWDRPIRSVWEDSQGNILGSTAVSGAHVFLEREIEEAVSEGWVLLETPSADTRILRIAGAATQSRTDFAMTGKATGLALREPNGDPFTAQNGNATVKDELQKFKFRTATCWLASEEVAIAGLPIREDLDESSEDLTLDSLYLDMESGRAISLSGERSDAPDVVESESIRLKSVSHIGGLTRLQFDSGTAFSYLRPSIRVNANVGLATHGETQEEILGSGDATQANQVFTLAKKPLTYVPAATESGSASTLTVRVNDIAWSQIDSLHDAGPQDEAYMVQIDDDGTTRVIFGDGSHGKRLPTGSANITAQYRAYMGVEGEVAQETLIQLKTRPLGIREVINASAAGGAAPPIDLESARLRVPGSVRTLGRIVSLSDYGDFARSFTGIGKVRADIVWYRGKRVVHVTVAPVTNSVFEPSSPKLVTLRQAMNRLRDPSLPLVVQPHEARFFTLEAKVVHDSRHLMENVEKEIFNALESAFGYERRDIAQSVRSAEVIRTIQEVNGVMYVDLDRLLIYDEKAETDETPTTGILWAHPARCSTDDGKILPAELLTVQTTGVDLIMEAVDANL